MTCQLCSKELADDEVYVCDQCASECPHLEVVEKIKGDGDDQTHPGISEQSVHSELGNICYCTRHL